MGHPALPELWAEHVGHPGPSGHRDSVLVHPGPWQQGSHVSALGSCWNWIISQCMAPFIAMFSSARPGQLLDTQSGLRIVTPSKLQAVLCGERGLCGLLAVTEAPLTTLCAGRWLCPRPHWPPCVRAAGCDRGLPAMGLRAALVFAGLTGWARSHTRSLSSWLP